MSAGDCCCRRCAASLLCSIIAMQAASEAGQALHICRGMQARVRLSIKLMAVCSPREVLCYADGYRQAAQAQMAPQAHGLAHSCSPAKVHIAPWILKGRQARNEAQQPQHDWLHSPLHAARRLEHAPQPLIPQVANAIEGHPCLPLQASITMLSTQPQAAWLISMSQAGGYQPQQHGRDGRTRAPASVVAPMCPL